MVDVFLDKRLDDYFTAHEWSEVTQNDAARDAVLTDFLTEKVAVLHGLDTGKIDVEFLESVRFPQDRKSTRLNSSHVSISYAVFSDIYTLSLHDALPILWLMSSWISGSTTTSRPMNGLR